MLRISPEVPMEAQEALLVPAPATTAVATTADFDLLVQKLAELSKSHLLYFRIEVGRATCETFFRGDLDAYYDRDSAKTASLRRFVAERADELQAMGLNEQMLRNCILAYFVVADLPPELVQRLAFSQVVELSRLEDGATRKLLAQAAVDNGWSSRATRDAVLAVRAGRWIDGDVVTPGLQPPEPVEVPPEPVKPPQPGRVVTRFEKTNETLDELVAQWEQVDVEQLTELQTMRVREAIGNLKARIARLEGRLGG